MLSRTELGRESLGIKIIKTGEFIISQTNSFSFSTKTDTHYLVFSATVISSTVLKRNLPFVSGKVNNKMILPRDSNPNIVLGIYHR